MESDRPIQKSTEDRFGRCHFAQRVAQVIASRKDTSSIVVGIHAPWGEGKTSVLNMIVEELESHEHILIVHFNPWRFPEEAQLLHSFFKTLSCAVDASLERSGEKFGEFARKYASLLAPVSLLGFNASEFVKGASDILPSSTLEQLKERMADVLLESGKRVVVVMDDIDRLDKEEIQAAFRLVKLSADFPNTAYILAFDEMRVAEALAEKYGSYEAGRSFLEKIVQVPLPLPPASLKARRSLTLEGIESALKLAEIELTNEQKRRFADIFDKAFLHRIETPRLAKRFANAMTFALPILSGEVETIDLILLEAVRAFYPNLYAAIREDEEIFLGTVFDWAVNKQDVEKQVTSTIEAALNNLGEKDKKAARVVIQALFPKTGASGEYTPGGYGAHHDAVWAREKRIASKYYFHRYFTYGVPPDDISDKELEEFIQGISFGGVNYVKSRFTELATNERGDVLIEKLRSFEDNLSPDIVKPLATGVALCGDVLPQSHPTDRFFGLGAYAQAAAMIRHLIQSLTESVERERLAIEIAGLIRPLPLAFDYWRWMRPLKREQYSDEVVAVVSAECQATITKTIAARIAAEANKEPLEKTYPLDAQSLYQFWAVENNEGVREYLKTRFRENPKSAGDFLVTLLGINPESESDRPLETFDSLNLYKSIAEMIEPQAIIAALQHTYSEIMSSSGKDARGRAAKWFVRAHEHITRTETQSANQTTDEAT